MSISFGNKNVKEMYFGNKKVAKVYFGNKLVWPKAAPIGTVLKIANCEHDDSRAAILVNISTVRVKEITWYSTVKITAINNKFSLVLVDPAHAESALDVRYFTTVAVGNDFTFVSSEADEEYVTEKGEPIYKTVVKSTDADGILIDEGEYYIIFETNEGLQAAHIAYDDNDTAAAYWQYDWNVPSQRGAWSMGGSNSNGKVTGSGKYELVTADPFPSDPVIGADITSQYDPMTDLVTWKISNEGHDISMYVDHYEYIIGDLTGTTTDTSLNIATLGTGTYTFTLTAVSKQGNTAEHQNEFNIFRDPNNYKLDTANATVWFYYTPPTKCKLVEYGFLTKFNASNIESPVNAVLEISSSGNRTIAVSSPFAIKSSLPYTKKTEDGETLYQQIRVAEKDVILNAGTTYAISISHAQWGEDHCAVYATNASNYEAHIIQGWAITGQGNEETMQHGAYVQLKTEPVTDGE